MARGNLGGLVSDARRLFRRERRDLDSPRRDHDSPRRDQDSPPRPLVLRRYFAVFTSSFFAQGIPRSDEAGLRLDDMLSDIADAAGMDQGPVTPQTVLGTHNCIVARLSDFDDAYGARLLWPCYAPFDAPDVVFLPRDLSVDGLAHFSWQTSLDQLGEEPDAASDAHAQWTAGATALRCGYHCAFRDLADRCSGELRTVQGRLTETQLAALSIGLCLVALEVIGVGLCSPQAAGKASAMLGRWLPTLQGFWSRPGEKEEEKKKAWWKKDA